MIIHNQSTDVLSDVFETIRAEARCSISLTAGGDWGVEFPMPSHIKVNAVREGKCWLRVKGKPEVELIAGDCFVVAGSPFILSSTPNGVTIPARDVFGTDSLAGTVGNGEDFSILGGSVEVDPVDGALLTNALPPVMTIKGADASSIAWLLEELDREWNSAAPGARLISNDLLRLIFLRVLRLHLASSEAQPKSWLSALADPHLARALQALHGNPGRPWTVASLAHEAGQSRSAFAAQFKSLLGEAPLEYLTHWRMRLAAAKLRTTRASIPEIAETVGYATDSGMSAAFRRVHGISPAHYRRTFLRGASAAG